MINKDKKNQVMVKNGCQAALNFGEVTVIKHQLFSNCISLASARST